MKTLTWKHTDWNARNFIFSIGQEIFGQLTFNSFWNFDAVYTDKETNLKFSHNIFWDRDVTITKDGERVGEIRFGLFATQTLKLATGASYTLSTSFWEQEAYWKTEKGETIVTFQQATMSSMGKGLISIKGSLVMDTEKLLLSSGLFARQARRK